VAFIFYDYETSGINKVFDQIYQFAAIRTDDQLNVISDPLVLYCKPRIDVIPNPEAILITGLDMDEVLKIGLTEYEFARSINDFFTDVQGQTICGYNSLEFDDEFTRFLFYRNLIDPYEWHWKDDNKRLDIYSLTLSTYVLRPDGIRWIDESEDSEVNFKLTTLSKINKIEHEHAHDALSDVYATLEFTKLIKDKQSKLFNYFQKFNDKYFVRNLITQSTEILINISRYYGYQNNYTLPIVNLGQHPLYSDRYVFFNLKCDPNRIRNIDNEEIERLMYSKKEDLEEGDLERPFIVISESKNPPIYKLNVLDNKGMDRCKIDQNLIVDRYKFISDNKDHFRKVVEGFFDEKGDDSDLLFDVDGKLYGGGFISSSDKNIMTHLNPDNLDDWSKYRFQVHDNRLKKIINRVLARNYPEKLTNDMKEKWNRYVKERLTDNQKRYGLSIHDFNSRINELLEEYKDSEESANKLKTLHKFVTNNYKVLK
jgi:exodeoxyribonuclease-1